jgi:signal transduction histidine kinase/CheY-like chemotaxis protein/purine-cytosine permease-like protein
MSDQVFGGRRSYNRFVSNQTLEDYSLRYTPHGFRKRSSLTVTNAAVGSVSFLALESIGASIAIYYGFNHLLLAVLIGMPVMFLISAPIALYAVRCHTDIDLLTRGAGFGYLGSSITSLIYASFTFIFLAFESAIMAQLLLLTIDLPLSIGYLLSALVVIPLILNGFTFISAFQRYTQLPWAVLQGIAIYGVYEILRQGNLSLGDTFSGTSFNPLFLGYSLSVFFALTSQIGEQVDYLRFMPDSSRSHCMAMAGTVLAGPGWIVLGSLKIVIGGILGIDLIATGADYNTAVDPNRMYLMAFSMLKLDPAATMALTIIFVLLSQIKINITNGYAGSLAWSNFFARITHTHPGRVVWVFFNVIIAWLLMNCGIFEISTYVLNLYSIFSVSWCGSLAADLLISKPLGLSPKRIEFIRQRLYDINPVGFGSMSAGVVIGLFSFWGFLGQVFEAYSAVVALAVAFTMSPLLAWATHGKYFTVPQPKGPSERTVCAICGNEFDPEDMCLCPRYGKYICSLCCTLESGCRDACKPGASIHEQFRALLPQRIRSKVPPAALHFIGMMLVFSIVDFIVVLLGYTLNIREMPSSRMAFYACARVYVLIEIVACIFTMLFILVDNSRTLAQSEVLKQNDLLEHEIGERLKTEKLLEEARKKADASNLAKTRYLSGISHELRTPLNTIMGYTQILRRADDIPENHRRAMDIICRSGDYLGGLIEGLLDISKIEAGRIELHPAPFRVQLLVGELSSYFSSLAAEHGLWFRIEGAEKLPEMVKADEKRLRQILTNLLSNAVKYTRQGGITLEISYRFEVAVFKVRDTGIGIRQEEISKIFDPFSRLDEARRQASGTGLGLTISGLLTAIMGGDLSVKSECGKGTEFTLKLLLPKVYDQRIMLAATSDVVGYEAPGNRRFMIAVIDDNADHRGLIRDTLSPLGFTVLEADGCDSGLELARREHPDLFFVDVSMPVHSGWDFIGKLRDNGIGIPAVMLSAEASEGKAPPEMRGKYNGYIIKPFTQVQLYNCLTRLLPIKFIFRHSEAGSTAMQRPAPKNEPPKEDGLSNHHSARQNDPASVRKAVGSLMQALGTGYVKGCREGISKLEEMGLLSQRGAGECRKMLERYDFEALGKKIGGLGI